MSIGRLEPSPPEVEPVFTISDGSCSQINRHFSNTNGSLPPINREFSTRSLSSENYTTLKREHSVRSEKYGKYQRNSSSSSTMGKFRRSVSTYHGGTLKQKFNENQKRTMENFSSVNYMPTHSEVYMKWVDSHSEKYAGFFSSWDRWFLSLLIGVLTGLVTVLLRQSFQFFTHIRWKQSQVFIHEGMLGEAWAWNFGIAAIYAIVASFTIVFIHPPAAGGGTAEVIAFLNGIIVHGCFSFKFVVIKVLSNVFAVASGMPAAIQGPLIAVGAAIGAGVGQFQSKTFSFHPKVFENLRSAEERRTFTTLGVAAGVAAAFTAPIGGLMFAMEDLSSHWTKRVGWQTFFGAIIATMTASLIDTAFTGFVYQGSFGFFTLLVVQPIQIHVAILIPSILMGILGGLGGAIFTLGNVVLCRLRALWVSKITHPTLKGFARIGECVLIVLAMSSFTVLFPSVFPCQTVSRSDNVITPLDLCYLQNSNSSSPPVMALEEYTCRTNNTQPGYLKEFNGAATLIQGPGISILTKLWTRGTHYAFTWQQLLSILPIWFFMTTYTCGSAISGGIFVPNLVSGALYGRLMGLGMLALYHLATGELFPTDPRFTWIDPGLVAVVGAASMLGGATRLAIASTVIVVEMCHDINTIIPVMISIVIAKFLADFLSKPLFKYQLDGKSLPVLDQEPRVPVNRLAVNLEMYKARDVMTKNPQTIHQVESVYKLSSLILTTKHSGFPIVKYDEETGSELLCGFITRNELEVLLTSDDVYNEDAPGKVIHPEVPYSEVSVDYNPDPSAATERIRSYVKFSIYQNMFIELAQYMSLSVHKVDEDFSLHRTYRLFRTLGLCHLVVTDIRNRVVGIITRKDLITFAMSDRLSRVDYDGDGEGEEERLTDVFPTTPPSTGLPSTGLAHSPDMTASPGLVPQGGLSTLVEIPGDTRREDQTLEELREVGIGMGSRTGSKHSLKDAAISPKDSNTSL